MLPPQARGHRYRNLFTGRELTPGGPEDRPELPLTDVLRSFPVACLEELAGGTRP